MGQPVMRALAVAVLALVAGCLQGGLGNPQVNYRLGHGNAMAAPGTSRGVTGSIVYRDFSGILTRTALAPIKMLGAPGSPWESECSTNSSGTIETCTYWLTQEAADQYEKDVAAWRADMLRGKSKAEASLEVAAPGLGGDTTGFRFGLDYPLFSDEGVMFKVGVAFGSFTMADRTSRVLTGGAGSVVVEEMTGDVKSSHLSLPVTVFVRLPAELVASYQLDWNLLRYEEVGDGTVEKPYHPQLSRLALERMMLRFVRVGLELQIDGMSTDSTTMSAEVGLAF